ncbi:hypothetical protein GUY44_12030 [Pimelobacter simplex]|uniref:hypothetical protein n=1 Tax=Nocardioides simplex TaxID=2045 RepID=UPI0005362468|nr:hypothetical protein [Pimelobacter simplex]MCG8151211.1 hypothetical protein [Pimelobacter simplex]GEB17194.1 hypothetical protein NSI01_55090 [Pimelobacter simplex]SFN18923.1 hypothetical protein SAMN05421671_0027 [Pimelobacter simplex]
MSESTGTLEGAPGADSEAQAARTDLADLLASWCSKSGHNMGHLLCGELVHRQHYEEADLILASSWLADHDRQIAERALAEAWDEGYDARGVDITKEGLTHQSLTPNPYRAARQEQDR